MIQTFVFFDIETTGLIKKGKMPKIIELSFVAVTRDNICPGKKEVPRVLQTLTVPLNPNMTISGEIENLTEFKNECLRNASLFNDKIFSLINNFLDTLMIPICFVAHNGYRFDYPIFLWELQCLNKDLDWNILCVDTLPFFKEFFQNNNKSVIKNSKTLNTSNSSVDSKDESLNTSLSEKETHTHQTVEKERGPKNFKLGTIHDHLLNIPPEKVHTAQGDCINMLRCVNYLGEYFLKWCGHNAKPLIEKG